MPSRLEFEFSTQPIKENIMNLKLTAKVNTPIITAAIAGLCLSAPSFANQYLSLSYGYADLDSSANSGEFPSGFTTGAGSSVPAGTALPAGTSVAWTTDFESGDSFSVAYGMRFGEAFRAEVEYSKQDNDVERHSGVTVADTLNIDGEDAGILITGSDNLGASVGAIVADARGSVEADYFMVNAYYDFNPEASFTPFIGAGLGYVDADVIYNPSGVGIVSSSESGFAYQVSAGASFALTDSIELVGQAKYRASEDFEVDTTLFPAQLDIENSSTNFDLSVRFKF